MTTTKVMDILDVWFDSGSTHAFTLRDRPDGTDDGIADVYMEGTDQHRGWFHSSLLQVGRHAGPRALSATLVTHGFTLDEKGMTRCPSRLGNIIAPEAVIEQYGADILRLWVAQTDYTADQRIGPEILKGTADGYRRSAQHDALFAGVARRLHRSRPRRALPTCRNSNAGSCTVWRNWMRRCAKAMPPMISKGCSSDLFTFATGDLSAFYFDIRKDALYCDAPDSLRRRAARTVLDILFHRLTTWLAPVLVFTMEDVWLSRFPGEDASVHLQDFPETPADWLNPALARNGQAFAPRAAWSRRALEIQRRDKVIGASSGGRTCGAYCATRP
jgi:isoleucyl-tRNA synthetase